MPEADLLVASLRDPDPRKRLEAVRQLAREGARRSQEDRVGLVGVLSGLADDPEPFVRWRVALALGELGHPAALPALRKLATDPHANTRLRAAVAAGMLDDQDAVPLLERLVGDPYKIGEHFVVRAFAAMGLGRLASPAGLDALVRLARDEDPVVRWNAVVALGDVGDPQAAQALVEALKDAIPFVRGHAAIALAEIGDPRHLGEVERAAARETHEKMKGVIVSAANLLRERPAAGPWTTA